MFCVVGNIAVGSGMNKKKRHANRHEPTPKEDEFCLKKRAFEGKSEEKM
jgi:hypothetical protein